MQENISNLKSQKYLSETPGSEEGGLLLTTHEINILLCCETELQLQYTTRELGSTLPSPLNESLRS